ncbi:hypothetical protein [Streptomyces sp. MspMP-M5]|uniref:hypothetical protein n=1 Tax=unclassified Streptomyces TaxID=2593676 RepID=UPI0003746F9D|nr:hypothetical protein [Streptomyces sp. MspMP-M5]
MRDYVKRLPPGALPEGGVASWSVADAERWRKARVPAVFAPVAGSWVLLVLVLVLVAASYVLTCGFSISRGSGGGPAPGGTDWLGYPAAVLLAALPLWYRYLPVPTVPAAVVVAVDAAVSLASPDANDRLATSGYSLALTVSAWALTGACLRLRARRRQRALALAAAGRRRRELPERVPETDGYRGFRQFYLGLALCLIAGAILTDGLVQDLTAPDRAPYDAVGQQIAALLFLVPGTTVYGRGHVAYRAARRLHEEAQPALMVGVRIAPDGYHWLYPDARTTSGRPLIAYFPKDRDTDRTARLLGTSSTYRPADGHYDVDPRSEPFEAVLYGAPWEGAEVALEYAVIERSAYQSSERTYAGVTVAPLLPRRRHGLGPWQPADGAARDAARRDRIRKEEQEKRERDAQWEARLRQQQRADEARRTARRRGGTRTHGQPSGRKTGQGQRNGRADSFGGGAGCGSGHSCGGHGHGCGGH